ncbi:acetyl/propionyl/methylcrotonyl-CoA carboxylase subunit alpha [Nitrococcus mobilis]|uniref:Biotin carboxylase n=1 Tax=Nitrococcus mobilis Nb-231 TaxID=314278 RepID=A4BVQ1_9GAMM|nr:acetyl/propionyl/methylcrotonyl-CoA carboxylase subunit alpha [Nitrococcus mobilis]EAR20204.1 Biotin/lipoyl attachment:Carbamoyl-phosphate synthase L chain, ATP-binding:Carbamoyl-phosphate synthetase large [Nitrococcus mobilis Nb-231]
MFEKILIANRGEIACRVARTCRRLSIRAAAIYSEADNGALHTTLCDEAWRLGAAPARESYLRGERILEIARASGAEAIHPGYGFLAENADFAQACADAGLVFIGPPAAAIAAMGSKSAAKRLMGEAGVPLVPGYHGEAQDPDTLAQAARETGYPVLIKPTAGGGGKGMHRVDEADAFADALAAAKREAAASFGDDRMLIEKYLLEPRHIEIQVFADRHGGVVHLFERDCSVQRRYQKVLEEAPAPGVSESLRREMGQAAVQAAQAIGYVGAGTVEFIVEPGGAFYFMEMNTRLQVEHPVTEQVTGLDLVEWQLRVAAGEHLPLVQADLALRGHAFEARVYAEEPRNAFLPAPGRLRHLRTPPAGPHVRIDTGVRAGDTISVHYDPLIAKLIVWDLNRAGALRRLRHALAQFQVTGASTNLEFLQRLAGHPAFAAGELDTGFIVRFRNDLLPPLRRASDRVLALACLAVLLRNDETARRQAAASSDPYSPWHRTDGWVLNDDNHHTLHFHDDHGDIAITAHYRPDHYLLDLPGGTLRARGTLEGGADIRTELDGMQITATVVQRDTELTVLCEGFSHRLLLHDPLTVGMEDEIREGSLKAPMPGTVVQLLVAPGDKVTEGQPLLVLEAMKMEYTIKATTDGIIELIGFKEGDQVQEGAELLAIASK